MTTPTPCARARLEAVDPRLTAVRTALQAYHNASWTERAVQALSAADEFDPMRKWQPIEMVPDDVTVALLFGELDGEISGPMCTTRTVVGIRAENGATWFLDGTDAYSVQVHAYYWMPLPEPPEAAP
jgi:hypothetical protein